MYYKKLVGLSLAGVMLLSNSAFAVEKGNIVENIKATPIFATTPSQDKGDIITAKEMDYTRENVKYNVKVPKIKNLEDMMYQEELNQKIMSQAMKDIKDVETQAEEEGWEIRPYEIFIDYEVKSKDKRLSFIVNTYTMTGGANGRTRVDSYNIDTRDNKSMELKDLFKAETDYKSIINKIISTQIKEDLKDESKSYFEGEEGFTGISDAQDFYLEEDSLVIVFQKYSIAPGYMGTPEFKIPLESIKDILKPESQGESNYKYFTGTVEKITSLNDGSKFLGLVDEDGKEANFVISKDTYVVNNSKIDKGSIVTGFYDGSLPMIMIYPPRYNTKIIVVEDEGQNMKVDVFDEEMVSSDNELKLNINDDTPVVLKDGTSFYGDLANRNLVVLYGPSTRSIPAQTSPFKVIVLPEKEDEQILELDVSKMDIVVNSEVVKGVVAYENEKGEVMVPISAIGEALGLEVTWNDQLRTVMFGKGISLTVGKDYYTYMKTVPIQLGTVPEIKDGRTYVPLNFFKEVAKMNNAYVFENQIVIDNEEKKE